MKPDPQRVLEVKGGHNVRSAALLCGHCGHVALHALAPLGLDEY